jgi:hypothetical protein
MLPRGLSITCGTTNRTSQTSESTLVMGYGANAARPRNVGKGWGLSVESQRTNELKYSDWSTGWSANGMMAMPLQPDPSGLLFATRFTSMGDQGSHYTGLVAGVGSAWLRGVAGNAPFAHFVAGPDTAGDHWTNVTDTSWRRYSVPSASTGYIRLETRDLPVGAMKISDTTIIAAFGAQVEAGVKYPSSYIPTDTGKALTRAADKLGIKTTSLSTDEFFHVKIRFAPNYASNEVSTSGEHDLLFIDGDDRLYLRFFDRRVVLEIGGQTLESPMLPDWQREDEITVEAIHSTKVRFLHVKSPALEWSMDASAQVKVTGKADWYILGNSNGAQECADLRYIGFFKLN